MPHVKRQPAPMPAAGPLDDDWPPPDARYRSALWRAEGHLERREYGQAARTLADVFGLGDERLVRGLHHLAAAGYKARDGDRVRARRQLAHARRRLEPYLPSRDEVDLQALLDLVRSEVES